MKRSAYITELILHCQSTLSGSAQFAQNTSQKNIISHPLHPGGHQAQHGGVRLRGAKVGTHGTRTGGKTTNGQTNGEKRQRRTRVLTAAGTSMRGRQAQRCHHQPVRLTAVLFNFSTEVAESEFRIQQVATVVNATGGVDTALTCTRADSHSSRAHITVHISVIDWLEIQRISVAHFSRTLSPLRHVFVRCSFRSFPSCRFISNLFSVTTVSVTEFVGEDQINPPAHWNVGHREHRNSPRHPKIRGIFLTDRVRHQLMVEPPATIDLVFCFSRGSCCFAEDLVVCLRMARRNMVVCGWPDGPRSSSSLLFSHLCPPFHFFFFFF